MSKYLDNVTFSKFSNLIPPLNIIQPKRYFISRLLEKFSTNWQNLRPCWRGCSVSSLKVKFKLFRTIEFNFQVLIKLFDTLNLNSINLNSWISLKFVVQYLYENRVLDLARWSLDSPGSPSRCPLDSFARLGECRLKICHGRRSWYISNWINCWFFFIYFCSTYCALYVFFLSFVLYCFSLRLNSSQSVLTTSTCYEIERRWMF
jgi:hypothetical protein